MGAILSQEAIAGGVSALSVFFVLLLFAVFVFLSVYVVRNISRVVENNTDALNRNIDKTDRNFDDIKNKQNEIHIDIKEILLNTKDK